MSTMASVPTTATTTPVGVEEEQQRAPVATAGGVVARGERAIVAAEVVLALVLGSIAIGRAPFFPDESYTWSTVNRGFPALVSVIVRHEAFQVLHTLLLWPVNVVSDSSAALRYPSVVFFAATVPAVWALGRRLFDSRVGLVAGLLLATNAFALQFAQDARSYTMAMMFAAYAAASLVRDVTAPTRWSRPVWIATSVAAVWSHGMAVFAIAPQVASLLALPRPQVAGRRFLRSAVIIGVLTFPVVLAPLLQVNRAESFPNAGHPNFSTLRLFSWFMVGRSVFALVPYFAAGAVAAWAGLRAARSTGRSVSTWRFALLFAWLLLPPVVLITISFVDPVWIERYAIPGLGGLVVLVAYGLTRLTSTRALAVALVCTLAAASWGVVRWYENPGVARFDALVGTIEARIEPGDVAVVATDRSRIPLEFALRHHARLRHELDPVFPAVPWGEFNTGDQAGAVLTTRAAQFARSHARRVWMVAGFYDPDREIATAVRNLRDAGFTQTLRREYDGPIVLYLFERANT
ncbi:MAG: hypothetical protein QOI55_315 [Actinomycetota bacterium]|nr:hypothetical protein [Actinomycetota bacterium]